ncbi:MAG TPA: HNH endonuclease signature motif containing protein, partial [Kofleriaceae bacterium]|nr:HNH endonuclease signature motif containing protein [Kofleriaceae bacterium]
GGSLRPATRTIPAATRRAVLARDHHRCQVPGCSMSRWVDVHHIRHWEDGGDHDPRNLLTTCELHHSLHHDGVIRIAGEPGALIVTHADGRPYGAPPCVGAT